MMFPLVVILNALCYAHILISMCSHFFRASAYDVFAPSLLNSAAGMGANPSSRRSSFRATAQEPNMQKENSPSPEKNDLALFVEEDRRMRRRGSQLYVSDFLHLFALKAFSFLFNAHTNVAILCYA